MFRRVECVRAAENAHISEPLHIKQSSCTKYSGRGPNKVQAPVRVFETPCDDRQTPKGLGNFTVMSTPPLDLHELCLTTCKQLAAAQRELNTRDLRINELESQLQLLAVTQELRALCPLYIQTTYCPPMFH
jgi:hypothetical protein